MNKLIVLTGPTAVGKTSLSIKLAHRIGGEIISCDSMQVYKGMDIGSAKIKSSEMDGINHYLIDILEPTEEFNVYVFKQKAKEALDKIYQAGNIPILVGGTGFYIQALLYDIDFSKEDNSIIRKELNEEAEKIGALKMYEKLLALDPEYANTLHPNNTKKVIRALEYIKLNGKKFSLHNDEERQKNSPYDFRYYVLTDDRERLYHNIDIRVDMMFEEGLLEEVKALHDLGYTKELISMQGLGYKELLDYFDGLCTLEEAKEAIKLGTRHFAKRQLTWFRREKEVKFINKADFDRVDERILDYICEDIK